MPGTGRQPLELQRATDYGQSLETGRCLGGYEGCWMRPDPVIATSCASVSHILEEITPQEIERHAENAYASPYSPAVFKRSALPTTYLIRIGVAN